MKKFKGSLRKDMALGIGFVLLMWVLLAFLRIDDIGIRESFEVIIFILIGTLIFVYGLVKQTYLVVEDSQLKFVSFFIERKTANISDIKIVTTSVVAGFMKFLCVIHYQNGREKLLQISPFSFSQKTLKEFVAELKKINPQIEIHETAKKLIG